MAQPVNATHAKAAGEGRNQGGDDCDCDYYDDEQRAAGEQRGCCGCQDCVDDCDECVEKNHLG
jgi:hypothetical protein